MAPKFCSQCKFSEYVDVSAGRMLRCHRCEEAEAPKFLTTDCTYAIDCPCFKPEQRQFKNRRAYVKALERCGIPLSDEQNGLLADVRLT